MEKDFRNELLKRREVKFAVESEKNPGFEFVVKEIAEKFKTSEENVAVKSLKNNFGSNNFLVEAFVYDSLDDKNKIEPGPKVKKSSGGAG